MAIKPSPEDKTSHPTRRHAAISSASTWVFDMKRQHAIARVAALVLAAAAASSCKDANVPFLTAPTSIPNSPVGMKNAMSGLFSATRVDVGNYILMMTGFGRDGANFTNT